jgi:hypothetical protein
MENRGGIISLAEYNFYCYANIKFLLLVFLSSSDITIFNVSSELSLLGQSAGGQTFFVDTP